MPGKYYTVADTTQPGKYEKADPSNSNLRNVVVENNTIYVFFSECLPQHQTIQIRVAQDGRIQLFSTVNAGYSFYLVLTSDPSIVRWQNEFNQAHFIDWRKVNNCMKLGRPCSLPFKRSISQESASSRSLRSPSIHEDELLPLPEAQFFESLDSSTLKLKVEQSHSRRSSVERSSVVVTDIPKQRNVSREPSPSSSHCERDAKQTLVTRVEPEVDELIGEYYAEEGEYRHNKKGRWGPPVLRGEDVLFIPAKKKLALENVTRLIEVIKDTYTIKAASMVCQRKKKRQKKGFLVYLQLDSADEVQAFLKGPYQDFESTVQGAKAAIFSENDRKQGA